MNSIFINVQVVYESSCLSFIVTVIHFSFICRLSYHKHSLFSLADFVVAFVTDLFIDEKPDSDIGNLPTPMEFQKL